MAFLIGALTGLFISASIFLVCYFSSLSAEKDKLNKKLEQEEKERRLMEKAKAMTKPKRADHVITMEQFLRQQGFNTRPAVEVGEIIPGQLPGETADTARRRMQTEKDLRKRQEDEERNRNRGEDILNSLLAGSGTYDSNSSFGTTDSSDSSGGYGSGCSDSGSSDSGSGDCGGGDI